MSTSRRPVLTAIVFAYHNEKTIERSVQSLLDQECDDPFEVVVATSGRDRTAQIVRTRFPKVRVAESAARLYPGGVRNRGIAMARGQFVAFLEADCVASPNWIRNRIALHRAGHAAVAGAIAIGASASTADRAWVYLVHAARVVEHGAGPANAHQVYGLSFTRDVLELTGGFDETVRSDEDTMIADRLEELGIQPWFDPSIRIEHLGPSTLSNLLRDQFHRGQLDSWEDTLKVPEGRLRLRWEPVAWAGGPFVVMRAVERLPKRLRWIVWVLRNAQPETPPRYGLLALPMALGMIAYSWGWIHDQLRTRQPGQHKRRGELPVVGGVRRLIDATGERVVALVFTDGPSEHTASILGDLERLGVRATFFVSSTKALERPAVVRRIVRAGHVVACSGWIDRPVSDVDPEDVKRDIAENNTVISTCSGVPVRNVLLPRDAYTLGVVSALSSLNVRMWMATSHPSSRAVHDQEDGTDDEILGPLTPGSIIWLHESSTSGAPTGAALPDIVNAIEARGFRFVTLDHAPGDTQPAPDVAGASDGHDDDGCGGLVDVGDQGRTR
jgi:peptidoglycan/xylan/chitin deacetylase (PgdA/CDA1 family)/glycosyltransferase involved in cell wall biosynthesis